MRLLVDIGNSAIKWTSPMGLSEGRVEQLRLGSDIVAVGRSWQAMEPPSSVWISSVLEQSTTQQLENWIESHWQLKPVMATVSAAAMGVKNGYSDPGQLGVDRWLGLLAAHNLFGQEMVIVDCGTATTIDAIDRQGEHQGGVILPGIQLSSRCLLQNTGIAPFPETEHVDYFADNTPTAIYSGAVLATVAAVEKMAGIMFKTHNVEIKCLLTGGGAHILRKHLSVPAIYEQHLVIKGLAMLAELSDKR